MKHNKSHSRSRVGRCAPFLETSLLHQAQTSQCACPQSRPTPAAGSKALGKPAYLTLFSFLLGSARMLSPPEGKPNFSTKQTPQASEQSFESKDTNVGIPWISLCQKCHIDRLFL